MFGYHNDGSSWFSDTNIGFSPDYGYHRRGYISGYHSCSDDDDPDITDDENNDDEESEEEN